MGIRQQELQLAPDSAGFAIWLWWSGVGFSLVLSFRLVLGWCCPSWRLGFWVSLGSKPGSPLLGLQVLAAIRGGVKHVLLPTANKRHVLEELFFLFSQG